MNKKILGMFSLCMILAFSIGYTINFYQHGRLTVTANVYMLKETPEGIEVLSGNTLTDLLE